MSLQTVGIRTFNTYRVASELHISKGFKVLELKIWNKGYLFRKFKVLTITLSHSLFQKINKTEPLYSRSGDYFRQLHLRPVNTVELTLFGIGIGFCRMRILSFLSVFLVLLLLGWMIFLAITLSVVYRIEETNHRHYCLGTEFLPCSS